MILLRPNYSKPIGIIKKLFREVFSFFVRITQFREGLAALRDLQE